MELAKRLRAARGYAGLSQPELAERLGFSTSTLKRLELGQRNPRGWEEDRLIHRAAEVCGLPVAFFLIDFASLKGVMLDDHGRIAETDDRRSDLTLRDINAKVSELLERWQETAMPAFTAYLDAQAAEVLAHDEEAAPSDEASATTQGRR